MFVYVQQQFSAKKETSILLFQLTKKIGITTFARTQKPGFQEGMGRKNRGDRSFVETQSKWTSSSLHQAPFPTPEKL